MRHLLIVNPVAGGRDCTREIARQVTAYFSHHPGDFEIYRTTAPLDARDKVKQACETLPPGEELRVYACGGDGTANECINGAYGHPRVAFSCCPLGTGNDFLKVFGDEYERFCHLEQLFEGELQPVDILACNDRYCLNICSVGIDARIGTDVHTYSALPLIGGKMSYLTSLVVNLIRGVSSEMELQCAKRRYHREINLVCVCNGQYYGGGFHPVPTARFDDGVLDVLVVSGVDRRHFVQFVGSYAKGGYARFPDYIDHLQCDGLHVRAPEPFVVNLDGEAMVTDDLTIRLMPQAMRLIVPQHMAYYTNNNN